MRRYLVWQHRWAGLLLTAFLVVIGVTGSLLAYRTDIDRLLNPQLYAKAKPGAKRLSLGELAVRAEAIEPRARVGYLYDDVPDSVSLRCSPRTDPKTGKPYDLAFDHLILNPWTGEEMGRRSEFTLSAPSRLTLMSLLYQVHTSFALGDFGWSLMGYVALVWTIDCFVAFYLTLPVGLDRFLKRWKRAWRVKWRASIFQVNFDVHRATGLWLWPLLVVFAWSGVMFNLNPVYETVTRTLVSYRSDSELPITWAGQALEQPRLDWYAAELRGRQLMTEQAVLHKFRVIRASGLAFIPEFGAYSYTVQSDRDSRHKGPETAVLIDANSGALKWVFLPDSDVGHRIGDFLRSAHFADLHDFWAYRLLVSATGGLIGVLAVTGVYIWLKKRDIWMRASRA